MEDKYFEGGWVKLYNDITKHPVFSDCYLFQLFIFCLLKANWKETSVIVNGQVVHLRRGQFLTGRKQLVKDLTHLVKEKSKAFVRAESLYRRRMLMLQELGCVNIKSTNKYSVITIQNWDKYQSNSQQTTIKQPSDDHQTATDKNIKTNKINKLSTNHSTKSVNENNKVSSYKQEMYKKFMDAGLPSPEPFTSQVDYVESLTDEQQWIYAEKFGGIA